MTPGAYGVLCKVLSLNPEKDFSVSWLCELLNVGRTAARNILKELVQLGYTMLYF
jgi:DNA-binding GntR family transcriptional regulator